MSVLSITEVREGRGASEDQGSKSNSRRFQVFLNAVTDDPTEARDAPGIPRQNEPHDVDHNSFVTDKQTEETENGSVWFVVVNYSTAGTSSANDSRGSQNPLRENPSIVWSSRDIEIALIEGRRLLNNKFQKEGPIVNSAGDRYVDPPLVVPDFLQICTVGRNEVPGKQFNPGLVRVRMNKINKAKFRIGGLTLDKRQGWLIKYEGGEIQERNGKIFTRVVYQILVARPGFNWEDRILDEGLRELKVDARGKTKAVPIKNINKKEITVAVNLDGKGKELEEGKDPVFLRYLAKERIDFAALKLPREYSQTGR